MKRARLLSILMGLMLLMSSFAIASEQIAPEQYGDIGGERAKLIDEAIRNGKDPSIYVKTQKGHVNVSNNTTSASIYDRARQDLQLAYETVSFAENETIITAKEKYGSFESFYDAMMEEEKERWRSNEFVDHDPNNSYRTDFTFEEYLEWRLNTDSKGPKLCGVG